MMHLPPIFRGIAVIASATLPLSALELPDELAPERVAGGFDGLEGPAWSAREQCLYFSNQEGDFGLHRYRPGHGTELVEDYVGKVNGNLVLADGSLITCESAYRRIVKRAPDGSFSVLVNDYHGEPLNEPNDIIVHSNGTLWFTTPQWPRNDQEFLFSFNPATQELIKHVEGVVHPNGLAFSPDERWLYLNAFGEDRVLRYPVRDDGSLGAAEVFIVGLKGGPDGMTVDPRGNLFICVYDDRSPQGGLHIFSPEGERIRHFRIPGSTTNCTFGGPEGRHLYITSGEGLYRLDLSDAY